MKKYLSILIALTMAVGMTGIYAAAAESETEEAQTEGVVSVADEGVAVEANEDSATGYTATFTYVDDAATNVQLTGTFDFYVDGDENVYAMGYNLEEDDSFVNYLVSPADWSADANLRHINSGSYAADMNDVNGVWTVSVDLPAGSYLYQYSVSYDDGETFEAIPDPTNVAAVNENGANQMNSQFYVPYDAEKQTDEYDDWTWVTPADDEADRGTLVQTTYTGADDAERRLVVYLPAGYDADREEPYKVLYLSHGGGGDEGDWTYQGNAGNVIDRLTAEGVCEPFILVNMDNSYFDWDYDAIFEDTKDYMIPFMEENYNVSTEASDRAYAGLSMGGMTTSEMFYRDPSLFGYFGVFSGAGTLDFPEEDDYSAYMEPSIFVGAGWADMALIGSTYQTDEDITTIGFTEKLDDAGIEYEGIDLVPGAHDWFTWPQLLRDFIETTLWK